MIDNKTIETIFLNYFKSLIRKTCQAYLRAYVKKILKYIIDI